MKNVSALLWKSKQGNDWISSENIPKKIKNVQTERSAMSAHISHSQYVTTRAHYTHSYVHTDMAPLFLTRLFCLHRFRSASTHLTPPRGRRLLKFLIYIFAICCCATLCNVACHTRAHTHYNMKCCCWYAIAAGSI